MNFFTKKIIEIYPTRLKIELIDKMIHLLESTRNLVKYVIIDMYMPYKEVTKAIFRNFIIAVDSFHVMKHLNDAMDVVI